MNLTELDKAVIVDLSEGKTIKEMSAQYDRHRNTIDARRVRLFRRMKARNAAHAVAIAFRNGILQ